MTDLLPLLLTDPVIFRDGVQHIRLGDDVVAALHGAPGQPVESFVPGWSPSLLYSGLAPFRILEFEGADGRRAAWLLDSGFVRLGDKLGDLDPIQAELLRMRAAPVLRRMVLDILIRPVPVLSPEMQAFFRINEALRIAIADWAGAEALAAPDRRLIDHLGEDIPFANPFAPDQPPALLSRAHLRAGFATSLEDRLVEATRDGMLCWPSPIDGRLLRCQGCLYLDDFRFAYRFADAPAGLVFYVIAGDHYCKVMGIYIPALDLMVEGDGWSRHLLGVYFQPDLAHWFKRQAVLDGPALAPYFERGADRIASIMRGQPGTHIGHQLWNELSGMEYLLAHAQGEQIPHWIIPGARQGTELWGAVDRLFPELQGRVCRELDRGEVAPHIYANGFCAVRVTREHVSAGLRRRLRHAAEADPSLAWVRGQAALSRARQAPVIILGLRVENRTLVDLADFLRGAIRTVAREWPGATLVIDGHNARGAGNGEDQGAVIESHGESLARCSPIEVERGIAAELRAAALGMDVTILDTLGASMATSLAWALECDCFLSIWGASLAKFRWVCNKPGLVITSRANLLERGDLHIYDSPHYMETPTRLLFADPASVSDDMDAPTLVPVSPGNPLYANFRVDHAPLLAQFRELVKEVMTAR